MALDTNFVDEIIPLLTGLTAVEKMSLSQAIYEKNEGVTTFEDSTSHVIVPGVRNGTLIPIINNEGNVDSFPFNDETDCSVPTCAPNDFKMRTHKWELGLIECRTEICMRSFNQDFLMFFNGKKDIFGTDDTQSALLRYITEQVQNNLNYAKWRVAYFADKTLASNLYNGFDGFFTQTEALEPNNVITITQNAGANYTAQKAITGLDIYNYLVAMDEKASEQIWNEGGMLEYRMTKLTAQILSNYMNGLKDKSCCDGVEILNPDNIGTRSFTRENLSFRGIPIRVINEWDTIINKSTVLNGGGGLNARVNPHRILLTYKENLLVGVENTSDLDSFDIWYEKKDKKIYIEAGAYLGAGVPLDNYILAI